MKKVLLVATVVKKHIMVFHLPILKLFKEMGWETAVAARNDYDDPKQCVIPYCDQYFDLPFERSPIMPQNLKCISELKKIIDRENYNIIHCHTPVGGVVTRIAAKKARNNGTKVLYTAHGFHFYKGAPLKNWLIYYPVEWLCAHWTDTLITINQEDYGLAQKKMHAKKVVYVPGIGIDLKKFGCSVTTPLEKRKEDGIPDDMTWMLSVGELIQRKNHETMIRAIADFPNVYLTIAGRGELQEHLNTLIKELNLESRVKLLGFRTDISELCRAADVFCMPSFQEGLPVALMEAMACEKPCVVSDIRGNIDLIDEENALFDPHSVDSAKKAIRWIHQSDMEQLGRHNAETVRNFAIEAVLDDMQAIYNENIAEGVHIN